MRILNKAALPLELAAMAADVLPGTVERYAALTADYNPIHIDPDFAARTVYGKPIAHGTMGLNLVLETIERTFGEVPENTTLDTRFVNPVMVGSRVRAGGVLRDEAMGTYDIFVETEAGTRVIEGICTIGAIVGNRS